MLYFSNREIKILRLITQKDQGISMNELIYELNVSKRTVYREISILETTLQSLDITVEKNNKLYQLNGKKEMIEKISNHIKKPLTIEWEDIEKRQAAILATIILKKELYSQTQLAHLFKVSLTTIQQDLVQLNEQISKYKLYIDRSQSKGLCISGTEVNIRLYLSQILSNHINEFDFFRQLNQTENLIVETESQYLLSIIDPKILRMVYKSIETEQPKILEKITDGVLIQFTLVLTVSLIRLDHDNYINNYYSIDQSKLLPYMQRILSIVKTFSSQYKIKLNTTELSFIAMQLRGINVQKSHSIFQDSYDMELAFNVKHLIKLVSTKFKFNFNVDQVLYQDLINHIGAALKRLELGLPEMENEVLIKLKEQYTTLYSIIEEKLVEVFSPAVFSKQEIGYVVTHFASSFEKYGYQPDLRVLVICTSGVGTSKILKTRLERTIPEIEKIDVVRAVDLNKVNLNQYSAIFSTIHLSDLDINYTLINPILDNKDISMIRQELEQNPIVTEERQAKEEKDKIKKVSFKQTKDFINLADYLIHQFKLKYFDEDFVSLELYIEQVFEEDEELVKKLNQRLEMSPLAIPNTGILLLHTTTSSIKQPVLKMHQLKKPVQAMGMDRKLMEVNRILVMLGPEEIDDLTRKFLGIVSSSVIEDDQYMNTYQKGTEIEIKEMLEKLSLKALQNILER